MNRSFYSPQECKRVFLFVQECFPECDQNLLDDFKKWVVDTPHSNWEFSPFRLLQRWRNIRCYEEREAYEKQHDFSSYCCNRCQKIVSKYNVVSFDHKTVSGKFGDWLVHSGTCLCKECFEKEQSVKKISAEENRKQLRAQWYQDHKEEIKEKRKQNRKHNAEKNREWNASHREQINQHVRERKKSDPVFKLSCQVRNTVYQSFARTGNVKTERCEKITGLPQDELIKYLVSTYKSNYGYEWDGSEAVHIDHIIPLSTAKTEDDVLRLCKYSNLQLLKAKDNLAKSNKLDFVI